MPADPPNPLFTLRFDCLKRALEPASGFSSRVTYRDPASPFAIHATLGDLRMPAAAGLQPSTFHISIASGALEDADKGIFPLAGLALRTGALPSLEPVAVVNPGLLSELQQVGLLDAVGTHLGEAGIHYAIGSLEQLTGLLAVRTGTEPKSAAFLVPGDLFLSQAVLPGLPAAFGFADSAVAFCFDDAAHAIVSTRPLPLAGAEAMLVSFTLHIAVDRLVATAQLAPLRDTGSEFTTLCTYSPRYDPAGGTLRFVPDPGIAAAAADAVRARTAAAAGWSFASAPFPALRVRPQVPARGKFRIWQAGLYGAVYFQGHWI